MMRRKNLVAWLASCIGAAVFIAFFVPEDRENFLIIAGIQAVTVGVVYLFYRLIKTEKRKYIYPAMLTLSLITVVMIISLLAGAILTLSLAQEGAYDIRLGSVVLIHIMKDSEGVGFGLLVSGFGSFILYMVFLMAVGSIVYLVRKRQKLSI